MLTTKRKSLICGVIQKSAARGKKRSRSPSDEKASSQSMNPTVPKEWH